jgi:hypothetical protein
MLGQNNQHNCVSYLALIDNRRRENIILNDTKEPSTLYWSSRRQYSKSLKKFTWTTIDKVSDTTSPWFDSITITPLIRIVIQPDPTVSLALFHVPSPSLSTCTFIPDNFIPSISSLRLPLFVQAHPNFFFIQLLRD